MSYNILIYLIRELIIFFPIYFYESVLIGSFKYIYISSSLCTVLQERITNIFIEAQTLADIEANTNKHTDIQAYRQHKT